MTIQIKVRIEARAAILARKAVAGVQTVTIEEADLASLGDDQLVELAEIVESGTTLESPLASEPTFGTVKAIVDQRVKDKAEKARVAREADEARKGADARAAEEAVARKRGNAQRDAENRKAIEAWLEENGDDDQKARFAQGFLSDEELIEEALHQIFEIDEAEHVPLRKEQACDCERGCAGAVRFAVVPVVPNVTPLDSRQFATLTRIQETAPDRASVEARTHRASCPECKCTPIARMTARVCLEWNGYLLVKEYSLG